MIDKKKLYKAGELILEALGEDKNREGIRRTPERIAKGWSEMFDGYEKNPEEVLSKTFDAEGYNQMIIISDIKVESFCEHHILPFKGMAWVGYIPNKRVIGLSKIHKLVRIYAHRLQIQERLTEQIANSFWKIVKPKGIMIVIKARHSCMEIRGVRAETGETITSAIRGNFKQSKTRLEFLKLIKKD